MICKNNKTDNNYLVLFSGIDCTNSRNDIPIIVYTEETKRNELAKTLFNSGVLSDKFKQWEDCLSVLDLFLNSISTVFVREESEFKQKFKVLD